MNKKIKEWEPKGKRENLTVYDFPDQKVIVQHDDGSRLELNYAFIEEVRANRGGYILDVIWVYSEHNGDHWFAKEDLLYCKVEPIQVSFIGKVKKVIEYWKALHWWRYSL